MLFDTISESASIDLGNVQPCKYEANLEGALMLVYENECNYNALMKSAGLSELKYYKETGGDLFVHEAGAFGSFLEKAKNFFKKVIEKIKALFKKFFMTITSFGNDDKGWVKKYEKDINKANGYIDDMQFKGYNFNNNILSNGIADASPINKYTRYIIDVESHSLTDMGKAAFSHLDFEDYDSDQINDEIETNRGTLIGINKKLDSSEFRDEIKDLLYGDSEKDIIDGKDINLRQQLSFISDTKNSIKIAEKEEKEVTKEIEKIVKVLDSAQKNFSKYIKPGDTFDDGFGGKTTAVKRDEPNFDSVDLENKVRDKAVKSINTSIRILQAFSNDITTLCGIFCQALKDRNRQAKAICIKAVSYASKHKNESAYYYDNSDDLFSNVFIR